MHSRIDMNPIIPPPRDASQEYYHILPPEELNAEKYAIHQRLFQSRLDELCIRWPLNSTNTQFPYPLYNAPHRVIEMQTTCAMAQVAFTALIREWWANPQFQSYIPLPPRIERVLRKLDTFRAYENIGAIKPDILIPESITDAIKICKINANSTFDAFFNAPLLSQASDKWDFCKEYGLEGGMTVDDMFRYYDKLIDKTKPVAVLIKKEVKNLHYLAMLQSYYPNARLVNPSELRLVPSSTSPSGVVIADNIGIIEQFMLELHQEEIEALDEDLLLEIGKVCWNDLRTIYLAHDKRMLGLIRKELPWLLQWEKITPTQASILENGIIQTYTPRDKIWSLLADSANPEEKNNWVLKKCFSEKGYGMLFGRDMNEETWKEFLKEQSLLHMTFKIKSYDNDKHRGNSTRRNSTSSSTTGYTSSGECSVDGDSEPPVAQYLLQRYIQQKKLDLVAYERQDMKPVSGWGLVGSVFCINRFVLPLVSWHINCSEIITAGKGGFAIAGLTDKGAMKVIHVPEPAKDPKLAVIPSDARVVAAKSTATEEQIEAVRKSLAKYGLAVVETQFEDPGSDYMVNLTKYLGEPLNHSSHHGILWDVKPVAGMDSTKAARSETMESFPWHTDCSFEKSPPRYFALHIIHRDRYGGGKLRLVHTDSLLKNLSAQTIQILQSPLFKLRVPKEFHKEIDHIVGPLLSTDGLQKLRYRRDIIEPLNEEAAAALDEVERSLEIANAADGEVRLLGGDVMKDGCIVLLDNAKWLHARSPIKDSRRWLRRIRWGPEAFL